MIDKLKDYVQRIKNIFNPYHKLDEALKRCLIDSFANSEYFSVRNIDITRKGFSLTLGYNFKKSVVKNLPKESSFLDYLPEAYEGYKRIYQSLYNYVINFENRITQRYNIMVKNLEGRLENPFNQLKIN